MSNVSVRPARAADSAAVAALRAHYALTSASWAYDPPEAASAAADFASLLAEGYPAVVAEQAGAFLGFASAAPFRGGRGKPGYRFAAETSVYVAPERKRRGVGRAILAELVTRAKAKGLEAMVGGIDSANAGSIALHEQAGFEVQGNLKGVGRKFGKRLDLVFMVKAL